MAHQTLYNNAINNTDAISALTAIYNGGWATDPMYLVTLQSAYKSLGVKFQWLDQEAIKEYGAAPYKKAETVPELDIEISEDEASTIGEDGCPVSSVDTSDQIVGQNSAPILEVPAEYKGGAWAASAKARGYTVYKGKPQVGWAVSFPGGVAGSTPPYGHIAVVEYVNSDNSILISETNVMNPGSGTRSWRVISRETVAQASFIQGGKH